jgi:hypothetical protein
MRIRSFNGILLGGKHEKKHKEIPPGRNTL